MDNLYILDIAETKFVNGTWARYNAAGKPRTDTIATVCEMGGKLIEFRPLPLTSTKCKLGEKIIWCINILNLWRQNFIKCRNIHNSLIFLQYPLVSCPPKMALYILNKLYDNGNKLLFIIHDLDSFRHYKSRDTEKSFLRFATAAIVHSPEMAKSLQEILDKQTYSVPLEYFDYRSSICIEPRKDMRKVSLIFAGNLSKAPFLKHLSELPLDGGFQINLYGMLSSLIHENQYVHYKGKFDANDFSSIEGNWGLVWDGESIDTCSGNFGKYLRINAPFKFSLYLAANCPVVVWRQSAMAQYVEQQHLGICVDSIKDIPNVISNLSDSELKGIKESVAKASVEVRSGAKLKCALQKILEEIM